MKAKLTIALAVVFTVVVVAFVAAGPANATQVISRHAVTADTAAEVNPDLWGTDLVWQQKTGSDWNIYYSDGLPGTVTAVCTDPGDQILPRVTEAGGHVLVVWEDHRNGNADIYGYDVTAAKEFAVCTDPAQQEAPRIAAVPGSSLARVVWQDKRNGGWDIYSATIDPSDDSVGPATAVCTANGDQTQPDVSGNVAVWTDGRSGGGDLDIYGYNFKADYTFPICWNRAVEDQPAVWSSGVGGTVVWRDARNAASSGTDIYGFDLSTASEFAVCTDPGDQSQPAVDQDLVAWTDGSSAARSLDVRGFDLTLQQEFPIVTARAAQSQPILSDYRVVWTDLRSGAADLWTAILTPWNASLAIDGGRAWTRASTATLTMFAQGKTGIVTQMTLANVGGPVGTPEPYGRYKYPWYLTPGDGLKTVVATFTDVSGDDSPMMSAAITVDTHGPTIAVPTPAPVKSGSKAKISYRVTDNLSPRAAVTVRLLDKQGNIVKVFMFPRATTGTTLHRFTFVCTLKPGSYRVRAWANDLAGNHQTKLGAATLTVKPAVTPGA